MSAQTNGAVASRVLRRLAVLVIVAPFCALVAEGDDRVGPRGGIVDCNSNGIDDAMDIDPLDPDGNGEVSADCNTNLVPDECDIAACLSGDVACADCDGNGAIDSCEVGSWSRENRIVAVSPVEGGDFYGWCEDVDGGRLAVGAYRATDGRPAMYFYERQASGWTFNTKVTLQGVNSILGYYDVTLRQDRFVVSHGINFNSDPLNVIVYQLVDGVWSEEVRLDPGLSDRKGAGYGVSSAMYGDRVVVGAMTDDNDKGRVYVFRRQGTTWELETRLSASDAVAGDYFGRAVAISENMIVVGAPGKSNSPNPVRGAVYVFEYRSDHWEETQVIRQSGLVGNIHAIGDSLAIGHGYLVIGDSGRTFVPSNIAGSAFVYRREGGAWVFDAQLAGSQPQTRGFGRSVAVAEETIVVGAVSVSQLDSNYYRLGKAYVFQRQGGVWSETAFLAPYSLQDPEQALLGNDVACSGNLAVVGAPGLIVTGTIGNPPPPGSWVDGAVYPLTLANDCNNDGVLDACEISGGATDLNGNERPDACEPDCNANGLLDEYELVGNDCNLNFVPDDCDADPSDPDGDGFVSGDCDADGVMDDCQIRSWPLYQMLASVGSTVTSPIESANDWMFIGASGRIVNSISSGAVDVYRLIGSDWTFQQTLLPPIQASTMQFGYVLATDGNRVVVGAPGAARVHVFDFDGMSWVHSTELAPPSGVSFSGFGGAVSLSGDRIVVGTTLTSSGAKAAVYEKNGSAWDSGTLLAPSVAVTTAYGRAVAIEGDWIAVGDYSQSVGGQSPGTAAMFRRLNGVWSYRHMVSPMDALSGQRFGYQVRMSEGRLAVGSTLARDLSMTSNPGAVYLFTESSGVWSQRQKLSQYDNLNNQANLGSSLSLNGSLLLAGAPRWRGSGFGQIGATFLYQLENDTSATLLHRFDLIPATGNRFAETVALARRGVLINSPQSTPASPGARYYQGALDCNQNLIPDWCETDCNGNGLADDCETDGPDIATFVQRLLSADAEGNVCPFDMNGDGAVDGLDIQPFVDRMLN
ncbi:MAG: hypothetical protein H6819_04010 [Phycisphaerales bacterium]|nr:hypothetical protein [Phycisphaerales bacterium]MCB9856364.1 hypothetical protein [Phycisphaerales bacterium]MCB9864036.1 hypothetical protein [Phycisphaerales bacterium]